MTVSKLTNNVKPLDEVDKINEIIDELDNANVAIDNSTITKNTSDQLQTVAVKDDRNGNAIKTWTGTKAQYNAIVTKDANTLYFCTDSGEIYLGSVLISNKTSGKDVGDVVFSLTPKTDAGLHLLDGALIQGSGIYSAFVTYIAGLVSTYPDLFVTESDWQTAVTTYGVCGKFVYDSTNNTVRLPKVTGKIDGTTDVSVLGDLAPLVVKLPNITGSFSTGGVWRGETQYITGAFTLNATRALGGQYNDNYSPLFGFDASRSSSVYSGNGSDTTIHEQAINVLLYIVIATSIKTDTEADIDDIATDLNGKADRDLSNTTPAISFATALNDAGIRTVVETYQNGTSWYRVYSDGWCEQGGLFTSTSVEQFHQVNLLKEMNNTNYLVFLQRFRDYYDAAASYPVVRTKSTTFFTCYGFTEGTMWTVSGYIS